MVNKSFEVTILITCVICLVLSSFFSSLTNDEFKDTEDPSASVLTCVPSEVVTIDTRALEATPENFSVALLPDTQIYSQSYPHIYMNQTQWIVNNSQQKNIVYVLHEGDITNHNTIPQWENANASQRVLDGHVPYTLSPGNHDLGPNGNAASRDTYMNDYFNLTEYQGMPTFGGAFEPDKIENTYHLFSAGGTDWMIVSLEFAPRDAVIEWANEVVAAHPKRIVLMVTHNYLAGNVRNPGYGGDYGCTNDPAGAATGEDIWQNFGKEHRNIMCIFCGHILTEAGYISSLGDNGNKVFQMLANFQMNQNGGNGYMRLVEFDMANEKINVKTYSPFLDQYKTESHHQFVLSFNKWDYVNEEPFIKNNIAQVFLNEDDDPIYLDLNGLTKPDSGIFDDPDQDSGDGLTFYIWTGSKWSDINSGGLFDNSNLTVKLRVNDTLRIEPKENRYGTDTISLKAVDRRDEYITTNLSIEIAGVNDPPVINETEAWSYETPRPIVLPQKIICFEDQWVNLTVTAHDPIEPEQNDILKYSSNGSVDNAPFFHIDEDTAQVSFKPTNDMVGIYHLMITVDDTGQDNNTYDYEFVIQINNTNDPPTITTEDIPGAKEDEHYHHTFLATDIDPTNDDFIWDFDTNASFIEMARETGNLSGNPKNDDVGKFYVNITVSDGNGGFDSKNFTLNVLNTNDPPIVNHSYPDFKFDEDTIVSHIDLDDWFFDIDGDILEFRVEHDDNVTVTITDQDMVLIEPEQDWSGRGIIIFIANDTFTEISDSVDYVVKPVNDPPTNAIIRLEDMVYQEGMSQPAFGNATDVDIPYGDELYFDWSSNVTGKLESGQEVNLSLPAGVHNITLTVKDERGVATNTSITLEVETIIDDVEEIEDDPEESESGKGLIIAAIAGVVIVFLVILFFIFMKRKKGEGGSEAPEREGRTAQDSPESYIRGRSFKTLGI